MTRSSWFVNHRTSPWWLPDSNSTIENHRLQLSKRLINLARYVYTLGADIIVFLTPLMVQRYMHTYSRERKLLTRVFVKFVISFSNFLFIVKYIIITNYECNNLRVINFILSFVYSFITHSAILSWKSMPAYKNNFFIKFFQKFKTGPEQFWFSGD